MASVKLLAVAGSAVLLTLNAAGAADLPLAPPPVPVVQDYSGWYLRGDIGFSNQQVKSIDNVLYRNPALTSVTTTQSFDAAPLFALGVGYQFNSWFRVDVAGEYRANANFHGSDIQNNLSYGVASWETNVLAASKSEWLVMANAYIDLGTWWGVTPFVGAGIGASYNRISGFQDHSTSLQYFGDGINAYVPGAGEVYAADAGKWNFAWALHAGLAYRVTPGFTVELAYRYINLGDAVSGDLFTYTGQNLVYNPMYFNDITSHDLKLGIRWMLSAPEPVYQPPLMRKG